MKKSKQAYDVEEKLQRVDSDFAKRLDRLECAFDQNMEALVNGIQMLEAQVRVLRRVANDLFHQSVLFKGGTNGTSIDFNAYLKAYIEELAEKEAADKETVPDTERATVEPEQDVIIFGGGP